MKKDLARIIAFLIVIAFVATSVGILGISMIN